jgi:hypothetical protein
MPGQFLPRATGSLRASDLAILAWETSGKQASGGWRRDRGLLALDPGDADHLAPFARFAHDERGELGWRAATRLQA